MTTAAAGALACAGFTVAGPASAADMLSVGVGGYMQQWFGYANRSDPGADGGFAVHSDSEIFFKGSLESDMGLKYSVHVELEGDGGETAMDESYVRVSGEFGQIEFGFRDHAMVRMHSGISDVGIGLTSGDTQAWIPGTYLETAGHAGTAGGGNDPKINYISPRAAGLQVGLSYAPDDGSSRTTTPSGNDDSTWGAGLNFKQAVGDASITFSLGHRSVGRSGTASLMDAMGMPVTGTHTGLDPEDGGITRGNYDTAMEIVELWRTHLDSEDGIVFGALPALDINGDGDETDPFEAAVAAVTSGGTLQNLRDAASTARARLAFSNAARAPFMREMSDETYTNVGVGVSFGAFGFNLAYAAHDGQETYSVVANDIVQIAAAGANAGDFDGDGPATDTTDESATNNDPRNDLVREMVVKDPSNDATIWGFSVSYTDGPMAVSLGHMQHEEDSGGERDATMLSASYSLAPGVAWKSSVFTVEDSTSHANVTGDMNEGTGFVTGIALSF